MGLFSTPSTKTVRPQTEKAINAFPSPSLSPFRTTFASLSLHMTDRIRLLSFPAPIVSLIDSIITSSWPRGIQSTRDYYGSYEFKLRGNPWLARSNEEACSDEVVHSQRLVNHILAGLYANGWVLSLSADVSKKVAKEDTLIFRWQEPVPAAKEWMCVAFSESDRVRFVDAPEELVDAVVEEMEVKGRVQHHGLFRLPGIYEVKLRGTPWMASGGGTMRARALVLDLVGRLEDCGFTVYASINQMRRNNGGETDTWHCCRAVGWAPGMPVFHG